VFYLVQRVSAKNNRSLNQDAGGFWKSDPSIFEFEYMGSAEFEFGEVPQARRRLLDLLAQYKLKHETITIEGFNIDIAYERGDKDWPTFFTEWVRGCINPADAYRYSNTKEYPHNFFERFERGAGASLIPPLSDYEKKRTKETRETAKFWHERNANQLYWSLEDNFLFAFTETGLMPLFLAEAKVAVTAHGVE
jgi:hypothetical protein